MRFSSFILFVFCLFPAFCAPDAGDISQAGSAQTRGLGVDVESASSSTQETIEYRKAFVHSSLGNLDGQMFEITAAEANIRRGPTTDSQLLASVHPPISFKKVASSGGWYEIEVPLDLLEQKVFVHTSISRLVEDKVEITVSRANMRREPNLQSAVMRTGRNGEKFPYILTQGEFYKVRMPYLDYQQKAYVHRNLVRVRDGVVHVRSYANLRRGPSTRYQVISTSKPGDKLVYIDTSGRWYHIAIPDVLDTNTRSEQQIGQVINVRSALNLRAQPSTRSAVIRTLRNGVQVEVLAKSGDWYKVQYRGKVGWVFHRYLRILTGSGDLEIPDAGDSPSNDPAQPDLPTNDTPPSDASSDVDTSNLSNNVTRNGNHIEVRGVPTFAQRGRDAYSSDGSSWRPHAYCGPTSVQMVLAYHGHRKSRDWIAMTHPSTGRRIQSSQHRGQIYAKGAGAAYAPMVNLAKSLGLNNSRQVWTSSLSDLQSRISAGRPQIVGVRGRIRYKGGGSWNTRGHVIVVRGFDRDGDVIVNDPAGSGQRHVIRRSDFTRIWLGFTVDIAP